MKKFLSKYLEIFICALTLLFLLIKPTLPQFGERISMLFFGTLSFYYLASGVLVFLDKNRVGRMMRLIYLFGLWSVSVMVIAIMMRTLLIQLDKELLLIAISSGAGLLLFMWMYYNRIESENKKQYLFQIQPLFIRSIIFLCCCIAILVVDNYTVYKFFGMHKNDQLYIDKVINAYEHPNDTAIVNDYKRYDEAIRSILN